MRHAVVLALALSALGCDAACVPELRAERRSRSFGQPRGGPTNMSISVDLPNSYAIDLPGTSGDEVRLADDDARECGSECSIFMRVRPNAQEANVAWISKYTIGAQSDDSLDINASTPLTEGYGRVRFRLCASGAGCPTIYSRASQFGSLETDVWSTIGWSADFTGGESRLFVGGAEVDDFESGSIPASWTNKDPDWVVGNYDTNVAGREVNGQVDDIMLWFSYELTPADVWCLHNRRGSANPTACGVPDPDSWCRGGDDDGGAGSTCTDYSGNGNDWALGGSAAFSASSVPAKLTKATASTNDRTRQVLIGLGQSNLSGRGDTGDLPPSPWANDADIYIYDNNGPIGTPNGTTNPAVEPWDSITGQAAVFPVSEEGSQSGVGPLIQAADTILDTWTSKEIGLIPCPDGGSEARLHMTAHGQTATEYFGECESRWASAAIGSATAEIAGMVIYQGECDAQTSAEATAWAYRWASVIESVRDSVGNRSIPAIVVVLPSTQPTGTACGAPNDYPEWSAVRTDQSEVCGYTDHCTTVQAPSTGYTAADNLHLDTTAQLALGDLIAAAFLATDYAQAVTP